MDTNQALRELGVRDDTLSAAEREQLDEQGFVPLDSVLSGKEIEHILSRLEQVDVQVRQGTLTAGGLHDDLPLFDAVWTNPRLLAAAFHVLGDFLFSGLGYRAVRPGHGLQALHTDWGNAGEPGTFYVCNAVFALVDFTEDNGSTRVVPGSHRNPRILQGLHDPKQSHKLERHLTGRAGTVFLFNSHAFHSATDNHSSETRHALLGNFSRRDSPLREMDIEPPKVSDATYDRLGPAARYLLGV